MADSPKAVMRASVRQTSGAGHIRYDISLAGQPPGVADGFFVEIHGDRLPPPVDRHDFVALALIFTAMRHGLDLHVEGRLSAKLLDNLAEFQRAWSAWRPYWYRPVGIGCDERVAEVLPLQRREAVLAYSGGVDSNFVLADHAASAARDACRLVTGVLVQGFDVPLDADEGFAAALADARASVAAFGLPLCVVRTDMRKAFSVQWTDEFGAALIACLSVFSSIADTALIAADHDYRHLVFPWGSNAITNPMLSSDVLAVQTWGAALTRMERVERMASHPLLVEHIRVCWLGTVPGRNCGTCEKCRRTQLNFMAAGIPVPERLGAAPGVFDILGLVADSGQKIDFLSEISKAAVGGPMPRPIRMALTLTIWKNRLLRPFRNLRRVRRNIGRWLTGRPLRRH